VLCATVGIDIVNKINPSAGEYALMVTKILA